MFFVAGVLPAVVPRVPGSDVPDKAAASAEAPPYGPDRREQNQCQREERWRFVWAEIVEEEAEQQLLRQLGEYSRRLFIPCCLST